MLGMPTKITGVHIDNNIATLRGAIPKARIAKEAGITRAALDNLEKGFCFPKPENARALARVLGHPLTFTVETTEK